MFGEKMSCIATESSHIGIYFILFIIHGSTSWNERTYLLWSVLFCVLRPQSRAKKNMVNPPWRWKLSTILARCFRLAKHFEYSYRHKFIYIYIYYLLRCLYSKYIYTHSNPAKNVQQLLNGLIWTDGANRAVNESRWSRAARASFIVMKMDEVSTPKFIVIHIRQKRNARKLGLCVCVCPNIWSHLIFKPCASCVCVCARR